PDGALYVCDLYRKTIEHPNNLPEAIRKAAAIDGGKDKGRIYRITTLNSEPKPKKVDLAHASVEHLCKELNNRDGWWRATAQRLLLERRNIIAIPDLQLLCRHGKMPETRVLAVRILEGIGALDDPRIEEALSDPDPGVRENGIQLAEPRLSKSPKLATHVLAMADDPNARVRFQCALSLGALSDTAAASLLCKERWSTYTPPARETVIASVMNHTNLVLTLLDHIATGDIPALSVNADRRQQLLQSKDETIKNRAAQVFKNM
ncbi:MAG TPA: HEAT repeat domain-containing protein, partial [Verrucomicrobiae bacterium]|nr:HEAT repeat domain-containing protein [Verrucomicrobiae bacterium]